MGEILKQLVAAALGAVVAMIQGYINGKDNDAAKRQIGTLEYENLAQAQELARAKAAATTVEIVSRLPSPELAERVRRTNDAILKAQSIKNS